MYQRFSQNRKKKFSSSTSWKSIRALSLRPLSPSPQTLLLFLFFTNHFYSHWTVETRYESTCWNENRTKINSSFLFYFFFCSHPAAEVYFKADVRQSAKINKLENRGEKNFFTRWPNNLHRRRKGMSEKKSIFYGSVSQTPPHPFQNEFELAGKGWRSESGETYVGDSKEMFQFGVIFKEKLQQPFLILYLPQFDGTRNQVHKK